MVLPGYFRVQQLNFALLGINPLTDNAKAAIERPVLCYGLISVNFFYFLLVGHYIYINKHDYMEMADATPLLCQTILVMVKIFIFLKKRHAIMDLLKSLNKLNAAAKGAELCIVRAENLKEIFVATLYFRAVLVTGTMCLLHPIIYAVYVYCSTGELVLEAPNKATYFWSYSTLTDYTLIYVVNIIVIQFVCCTSLAIDSLFAWLIRNILAQFHILFHRFHQLNSNEVKTSFKVTNYEANKFFKGIASCIQHHCQALDLADKLNAVYGEIIFIKFVIICTEICCLVFYIMYADDSLAIVAYKFVYLTAVTIQLSVYCYNGQRIKDETALVSTEIYDAFDWSRLDKSNQKLLLIAMMRSKQGCSLKGVFFEVDLVLYLWVFKTAGSLITALKTMEENQE